MPRLVAPPALFGFSFALCACLAWTAEARAPQVSNPFPSQTTTNRNQRTTPQVPGALPSAEPNGDAASDPFRASMEARRLRMQNDDRYRRMVNDTEKLYALSSELKEDINKSTKNELSLDVIKKAAEIEKLAHDVKERMRS